ncbi:MAG: SDR family NAD(P)-dependent oxidoreductase [Thermodesulfobacteriota bacterium]|nr:SDR family NAD(P)-dependent oxidoreductase [Thermodesulfobacteriota bacterium]
MNDKAVVIITGASRGVGASVARWLGRTGARLVVAARSKDGLLKCAGEVEKLGGKALAVPMDVSDPVVCRDLVIKTLDTFGRIDGVINNAAVVTPLASIENADPADWKHSMGVNVIGPFHLTKYSLSQLRINRGRIINVSSGAAILPIESAAAYCASKAALNHFTSVLAVEEPNITTVAIRPGVVDTDMQAYLRKEGPRVMPRKTANYYLDLKTKGKLEPPEIPARSIAWLALHAPDKMSGAFRSYDDADIIGPASKFFGAPDKEPGKSPDLTAI